MKPEKIQYRYPVHKTLNLCFHKNISQKLTSRTHQKNSLTDIIKKNRKQLLLFSLLYANLQYCSN